jgi:hypothetical protein
MTVSKFDAERRCTRQPERERASQSLTSLAVSCCGISVHDSVQIVFGAADSIAGPMTLISEPREVLVGSCPRCDWPVSHKEFVHGFCVRCGRHLGSDLKPVCK